jgi:hypothetical protein
LLFAEMSIKLVNGLFPDITIQFLLNDARKDIDYVRRRLGSPQLMGEKAVMLTPTVSDSNFGDYDSPSDIKWQGTIEVDVDGDPAREPEVYSSKDILQCVITEYSLNKLERLS